MTISLVTNIVAVAKQRHAMRAIQHETRGTGPHKVKLGLEGGRELTPHR